MGLPEFDACIFDMDGLLLDTEHLAVWGWITAARSFGFEIAEDIVLSTVGLDRTQTDHLLGDLMGGDFPVKEVRDLRNRLILDRIDRDGVPVKPGARELIGLLRSRNIPCAVATSTQRSRADHLLGKSLILPNLSAVVCGDEIPNAKPAPDIYREAARLLSVPTSACLVFEDSAPGITAAHRAGTIPILVPDLGHVPNAARAHAVIICDSLSDAIPLVDHALRFFADRT
jgi:HAD superfamily hydrolase (TIGR01509 family)